MLQAVRNQLVASSVSDAVEATVPSRVGGFAVAALPLGLLVVDPAGLAPFGPVKWLVVSAGVFGLAALTLRGRRARLARVLSLLWMGLLGWIALSAVLGLDPLYAWTGTPERHFGVLAWLLCGAAFVAGQALGPSGPTERVALGWSGPTGRTALGVHHGRVLAWSATAAAGVMGAWVVAEVLGWEPVGAASAGDRFGGPFGSPAYLGAAAALLVPVAVGMAADRGAGVPHRRLAALAATLGTVALVASGARAAWVGVLAAAVAWLVIRRPVWGRRAIAAAAVAAVAVCGLAAAVGTAGRVDFASGDGGGVRGRLDEWRVAVHVIADNPLVGVGPEGYRIAFGGAVADDYERRHGRDPLPDRAHQGLLDVAAASGLPGALLYGTLLVLVGRRVLRAMRGGPVWVTAMAVGWFAYVVQSMFLFPLAELDPLAWMFAGVIVVRTARDDELVELRWHRSAVVAFATLSVVTLGAGVLDVAADRASRTALERSATGREADADAAARLRPDGVRYRLVAARVHEAAGTPAGLQAALDDVGHALDMSSRDPVARSEQARLLLERARRSMRDDHVRQAQRALEELADDDPRNAEVLLRVGLVRALGDDDEGARQAWLAAEELAPRSAAASTNLALSYLRDGLVDEARGAANRAIARDPEDPGTERAREVLRGIDGT